MSLQDRFRIDELVRKGSKTISRDESGEIKVRRVNKKEVLPTSLSDKPKPFGSEPIKSKEATPRLKSDTLEPTKEKNPNQESFSGETATYIEKPIYNEEELKKAVDLKVDELIKQKKPKRGDFVRKKLYTDQKDENKNLNELLRKKDSQISSLKTAVSQLSSQIESLQSQIESALEQVEIKDKELNTLLEQYNSLLSDFQNSVIKGTKEAVERASVTAQVRGLQAQKETLSAQLEAQKGINENLKGQIDSLNRNLEAQSQAFQGLLATQQAAAQAQLEQSAAQTAALSAQLAAAQQSAAQAQAEASKAQAESASKGRKIICNELYNQGYLPELIWDADEKFGDMMFEVDPKLVIGYQMWARKVVKFMKENPQYTSSISFILKPWTLWMAHQMGTLPKTNWRGYLTHLVGKQFSYLVFNLFNGKEILQRYKTSVG